MSADILEFPLGPMTAKQAATIIDQISEDKFSQACLALAIYQNLPRDLQASFVLKINSLFSQREVTSNE